jgi:hypothetical protein
MPEGSREGLYILIKGSSSGKACRNVSKAADELIQRR